MLHKIKQTIGRGPGAWVSLIVLYVAGMFMLRWWLLLPRRLDVHAGDVFALAFSPDGKTLASMNGAMVGKHKLVLWDVQKGTVQKRMDFLMDTGTFAFSPDGKMALLAAFHQEPYSLDLWDLSSGDLVRRIPVSEFIGAIRFAPDGKTFATVSYHGTLALWDAPSFTVKKIITQHASAGSDFEGGNRALAFSPEGSRILCINDWKLRPGHTCPQDPAHPGGQAELWNIASGKLERTFPGTFTSAVAFCPDGLLIACVGEARGPQPGDTDGHELGCLTLYRTIEVCDVQSGAIKWSHGDNALFLDSVAFSPDGRLVASEGSHRSVVLWDTFSGNVQGTLEYPQKKLDPVWIGYVTGSNVAFSPDGKLLAGRDGGVVNLWNRRAW